ncbi:SSI family serine proteinase inhibitor [Micromonospora sp. CPCC 206061]|uniref:SSI family serine proteinase inhibitor n=1 Tax=Micromonospora sp. CPCC 206061 TaxID=3122410 RepID=UPI002FF0EF40
MRTRIAAVALAALGALALAAPSAAASPAADDNEVRIYSPSGVILVDCGPVGPGLPTHPHQKEVCSEISDAKGDIASIPPLPGQGCTDVWDPVLIGVTGRMDGKEILFSEFQSNSGCAAISHGHVFLY